MEVDSEAPGMSLEAIHQTSGRQAEAETPLLTIGPGASVGINSTNLNECDAEGANGSQQLAARTDAWTQRPAMFEVSQTVGSVDPGTQRIYGFNPISGLNEQVMDLLSMNWMSPDSASFGWNGVITAPPYAEDDKTDLYMPFLFPASGALPDPDQEGGSSNGQEPGVGRNDTSISTASLSAYTPSKLGSEGNKSMTGSYYVDGDGSRAPFRGQTAGQWRDRRINDASTPGSSIANCTDGGPGGLWEGPLVSVDGYNNLIRELGRENLVVDTNFFPSLQCIEACIHSYFAHFHPIFPFIRRKTFLEESTKHWKLLFAVAVVGSKYNTSNEEPQLSQEFTAMLEGISGSQMCHRGPARNGISLGSPLQGMEHGTVNLPSLQAASLSLICALHRGKSKMTRHALIERHYLVEACNELNLLSGESEDSHVHQDYSKLVQDWSMNQSRIRTGLMIWVCLIVQEALLSLPPNLSLVTRCYGLIRVQRSSTDAVGGCKSPLTMPGPSMGVPIGRENYCRTEVIWYDYTWNLHEISKLTISPYSHTTSRN